MDKLIVNGVTAMDIVKFIVSKYKSDDLLTMTVEQYTKKLHTSNDKHTPTVTSNPTTGNQNLNNKDIIPSQQNIKTKQNIPVIIKNTQDKKISPKQTHYDDSKEVLYAFEQVKKSFAWINCDAQDITKEYGDVACAKSLESGVFTIIINTGTYKFEALKNNTKLLSMHIAECIFRCILEDKNSNIDLNELDSLMDIFYNKFYESIE